MTARCLLTGRGDTAAQALGLWCPFLFRCCRYLWRLVLWRFFLRCLCVAPYAAYCALPVAPSPAPCERCVAPYGASYDWCAGPDVVPWHQCAGPDAVARQRCAGPEAGSGAGPHLAFEPQHPMLLAPRLAFRCQTRRLFPKFQASFDARSCSLQFFHSCSASLSRLNTSRSIDWDRLCLRKGTLSLRIVLLPMRTPLFVGFGGHCVSVGRSIRRRGILRDARNFPAHTPSQANDVVANRCEIHG